MEQLQLYVVISTIIIFVLSLGLAITLTKEYFRKKGINNLFWSLGMWVFTISTLLQIYFATGFYNAPSIDFYLFLVVILVQLFALGSIQAAKSEKLRLFYYGYTTFTAAITAYSVIVSDAGNLLQNYVVAGLPPNFVIYASSIATFPAALVIIIFAWKAYSNTKNLKLLSIIAGVVVVSVAGTLYIAAFPEFLYFAELFGVMLLWIGFFNFKR